jgi:hypothetical protein
MIWFLVVAGLSGCGRTAPVMADSSPVKQPEPTVRPSREVDDVARFVAGLPGTPGSSFAALEDTAAWKEHRRLLDNAWRNADAGMLAGLRRFQKQELSGSLAPDSPVFYPFGGPDALTATIFFPDSPLYVMVGLEPSGTLPSLGQFENKDLPQYLSAIRGTMASELGRSFFITHEMDNQFRGQVTDGLVLPIIHLLARTNHTLLALRYVRLNENSQIIDRAADYHAPSRFGNKGIELEFRSNADQSVHRLYYYTVNLANDRLLENQPFMNYVPRLKGATTFLKATSYMTHHKDFSTIRDLMLANSGAILQDDSGIPYRWFGSDAWKVQLYGDYDKPYGTFRWMEQPDLRKAFQSGAKPLGMRIGYGYRKIASNLLLAKRTATLPSLSSLMIW